MILVWLRGSSNTYDKRLLFQSEVISERLWNWTLTRHYWETFVLGLKINIMHAKLACPFCHLQITMLMTISLDTKVQPERMNVMRIKRPIYEPYVKKGSSIVRRAS